MNKLQQLKNLGLIGCLNDTGIDSTNYKEKLKENFPHMHTLQHITLLNLHGSLSTALLRRIEKCTLFEAQQILNSIMNEYEHVRWEGPYKITLWENKSRRVWKNVYRP